MPKDDSIWLPYFGITTLDILWRTVQDDLPPLITKLERATPGEFH